MRLSGGRIEERIERDVVGPLLRNDVEAATRAIPHVLDDLYAAIPEKKRISFGVVHTIKVLSEHLYRRLSEANAEVYDIASSMFEGSDEHRARGVALGVLSYCGLSEYHRAVPFFEQAAASPDWNLREHAQMFFRRLIERWPDEAKADLLRLAESDDPNLRRFVSETLRPVQENRWFYRHPDYPLEVLRKLFREASPYPRTSVGNNLSDLARRLPELVYDLVGELVQSGDDNSRWIATRACRNLVRQDPVRVMDLLGVDEYRYKDRVYRRSDCQGS